MTYRINTETTGLDNDQQVKHMAELLRSKGYAVEFTRDCGLINGMEEDNQFEGGQGQRDWENALIAASNI